ncbi:MAG: hypothetical protein FKGGLIKP_00118 [Sodalis sp. Fse]|nr:MAG: hypothetical protein FKGGLIKP_00118 [Sodalis sp. Fse]
MEQNDKLKHAIILSIELHCVLIAILIWSSIYQSQKISVLDGISVIDAVMVESSAVVQQYNHSPQQTDVQRAQLQHSKQSQQSVTQQAQLKERLVVQKATKEHQPEQKQAKTVQQEKSKAAQEEKQQTTFAKQSSEVADLLDGLTDAKNALKLSGKLKFSNTASTRKSKQMVVSYAEINDYKALVSQAISNKFYDASSYSGKTCDLHIKLAPDGTLISVIAIDGDPILCQAAVSATKLATIPKPPSTQVYEVFKNAMLGFSF